jgi:hypothetical protein
VRWRARTIVQLHGARRTSRPQLKRDPLGSDTNDMDVFLYLLLGALFAFTASVILKRSGWRRLALITLSTVILLLVVGLWLQSRVPRSETAVGLPILLAVLSPTLVAGVIFALGRRGSSIALQCLIGAFIWAVGLVITTVAAVSLNWITF